MTPVMATGVISHFPTLKILRDACSSLHTEDEARRRLGDLEYLKNPEDGSNNDTRKLGPQMGFRLWSMMRQSEPTLNFR